jgi:uncharacterized protein YbjQ (UPF0145 family)
MSPRFGRRRPPGDPAEQAVQEQRDRESVERLEQGRIPLAAAERLAALASGGPAGAYTTDLSVAEFSLLQRLGIEPVTVVMGSSIFHVGWQNVYYNTPTEMHSLSDAYNESRRLALSRLLEETTIAGADAVVGVRLEQGAHDWAPGSVEFLAVGTAVRLPPALRGGEPVLTDLDGQQFWQLCAAGIRPVGLVAATSVHYAPAGMQTMQAQSGFFGASWRNQELVDYTAGLYAARRTAMSELHEQARRHGADGVVGVSLRQHVRSVRVQRMMGVDSEDIIVTLHVLGTAIREDPALAQAAGGLPAPSTVLDLSAPAAIRPARSPARLQ